MTELKVLTTAKESGCPINPKILVVDDNQDAAHTLTRLLNLIGYSASEAHDGASAINYIESNCPILVLLDLSMPGIDGIETAKRIRQMPQSDHVQLIALTGHEREEDVARTQAAGFVTHLVKPVNLSVLERLLIELVGIPSETKRPSPR